MSAGSFSASLSGLYANQLKLSVIGNNLANINTVAFKASNAQFADLISQSVGGPSANPMQVGLGVTLGQISPNFIQGGVEATGIATHAAIQGSGFFIVGDAANRVYTRAGNFGFDATGTLVTADGQPVQGYTAVDPVTGNVIATGQPGNIVVPPGVLRAPVATTTFGTMTNLDASAAVGDSFSASVQVYDSLGEAHVVTVTYTKTGVGAWSYDVTVPGDDVVGGTPGTPFSLASGTLTFDNQGQLATVDGGPPADIAIPAAGWINGSAPVNISWDLVDANGDSTLTQYATESATASTTQNGSPTGAVASIITINQDGELIASFGLGRTVVIGQLAMASFNNPQGLVKAGANYFSETEESGSASIGVAGSGGRGSLIGAALEQSNVDIAQEFTQMILAQRGYQANAKAITVADELMVDTLNIKR
jgi:flagellar hook protein FlgE